MLCLKVLLNKYGKKNMQSCFGLLVTEILKFTGPSHFHHQNAFLTNLIIQNMNEKPKTKCSCKKKKFFFIKLRIQQNACLSIQSPLFIPFPLMIRFILCVLKQLQISLLNESLIYIFITEDNSLSNEELLVVFL